MFSNSQVDATKISVDFREECQKAAEVALSIGKLRRERQHVGFVPLSLADYIKGMAKVTNISLSSVLGWLGIADLTHFGPGYGKAMARLAKELGISLRETLVHLRVGFAGNLDVAPITLLVARRRSGRSQGRQLEECESVLEQIESEYDQNVLTSLRQIESEVRMAYEAYGGTSTRTISPESNYGE
jgi:hypothetical protein